MIESSRKLSFTIFIFAVIQNIKLIAENERKMSKANIEMFFENWNEH